MNTAAGVSQTAALHRSAGAGLTFARVRLPEPASELQIEGVTAIGLDPRTPRMSVSPRHSRGRSSTAPTAARAGDEPSTTPAVSRPARVSDIEFTAPSAAIGSAILDAHRQGDRRDVFGRPFATATRDALVGTSNGAFRADLTTGRA